MAPKYIKTPWSFQRFRKWEWGWSRRMCVCVCGWVRTRASVCVGQKQQWAPKCYCLPLIQPGIYYRAWRLSKRCRLLITGETDESACGWSKPFLLLPPSGCLGLGFVFLCSLVAPLCGLRSQACVYQCSSFPTVPVTSLARDRLEVFEWRIWRFSQSTCPEPVPRDAGWFKGLHRALCAQGSWGSLGVTGLP